MQTAAFVGRPTSVGRRQRPSVWSAGMRACQYCGGQHVDNECAGDVGQMQEEVFVSRSGRRTRGRRRPSVRSEGRFLAHPKGMQRNHNDLWGKGRAYEEATEQPQIKACGLASIAVGSIWTWSAREKTMRLCL
eukprot:TRINITY_DN10029_c0_g1_i3.p1 TRINITY_DN10029_c0_g1~~TRINITY_DN10029_c0_g1_i3.p1  ORF type:complete len:133 (+),score=9.99 TRINITY_DN10029_c0_g1_i3:209-607(+)